ncbi:Calmodulin [Durusdinium trenchii]|uniref:Calmodulin n=1 Tax=Durusdinium trenchii TaxID=1381693 RepID=A0ABP0I2R8_9DINO
MQQALGEQASSLSQQVGTEGRRKLVRIVGLVVNPLLAYGVVRMLAGLLFLTSVNEFDPRTALVINAARCSVHVSLCGEAECPVSQNLDGTRIGVVEVQNNLLRATTDEVVRVGTSWLEYLTVESSIDCQPFYGRYCDSVCSIRVKVPQTNSLHLKVNQLKSDSDGLTTLHIHPGVHLDLLTVSGTSLFTSIRQAVIHTKARVTTGAERIEVYDSTLTSAFLTASQSNIRVIYSNNSQAIDLVEVDYRATTYDERTCFLAGSQQVTPIEETMATCTSGRFLGRMSGVYDEDSNRRISETDFTTGVQEKVGKCCGSQCPVRNLCQWSLSPLFVPYGSGFVTNDVFFANVLEQQDYTVVPWCTRKTLLARDATLNLSSTSELDGLTRDYLNVKTDHGGVQVVVEDGGNVTETSFGETLPVAEQELRLTQASAVELHEKIRDVFGDGPVEEMGDVYVVFFVDSGPYIDQYGLHTYKFIYTNNPIYHTIAPSVLSALSLGLLGPEIRRYRLDFVAPGCSRTSESAAVDIGKEIFRNLVPRFRTSLWGTLVLVDDPDAYLHLGLTRFIKDPSTGSVLSQPFKRNKSANYSLVVSFVIGVIMSTMILSKFNHVMRIQLLKRFKKDDARRAVLKRRLHDGIEEEADKLRVTEERALEQVGRDRDRYSMGHVLERPVELCDVIFVDPVRRYVSDSLCSFINQTYFVDPAYSSIAPTQGWSGWAWSALWQVFKGGSSARINPEGVARDITIRMSNALTMSEFLTKYESFCFDRNLDMCENIVDVKRRLLSEHGVRARGWIETRLYGCRWKGTNKPLTAPHDFSAWVRKHAQEAASVTSVDRALRIFLRQFCQADGDIRFYINCNNMLDGSTGKIHHGFNAEFHAFLRALDFEDDAPFDITTVASLSDQDLSRAGIKRRQVRVETLRALRPLESMPNNAGYGKRYSLRWYLVQYLETLIHQTTFAIGPAMVLQVALAVQETHSSTLGDKDAIHSEDILFLAVRHNREDFEATTILELAATFGAVTLITCYVLLFFVYMNVVSVHPLIQRLIRISYRLVFTISLFILFTFLIMQCVWVMLAAFLNPNRFLPFGASLSCFFTVITYQFRRITGVKSRVEKVMRNVFDQKIAKRVLDAMALRTSASSQAQQLTTGVFAITNPEDYEFDPNDLFDLINTEHDQTKKDASEPDDEAVAGEPATQEESGGRERKEASPGEVTSDGATASPGANSEEEQPAAQEGAEDTLTREEFDALFDTLEINTLPSKREMLFAYCDVINTDNLVSREEFLNSWDFLVDELASSVVGRGLGLSTFQIAVYLVALAAVLILLFSFLLVSIAAFQPNGGLDALIQSAIIAGASGASASASDTFGAASSAMSLSGTSEEVEQIVSKEVDEHIKPETTS